MGVWAVGLGAWVFRLIIRLKIQVAVGEKTADAAANRSSSHEVSPLTGRTAQQNRNH